MGRPPPAPSKASANVFSARQATSASASAALSGAPEVEVQQPKPCSRGPCRHIPSANADLEGGVDKPATGTTTLKTSAAIDAIDCNGQGQWTLSAALRGAIARSQTAVADPAGGFVFRPAVETPISLVPKGVRRATGSVSSSRPSSAPTLAAVSPTSSESGREDREGNLLPRIAWVSEDISENDAADVTGDPDLLDMATKIRRDLLAMKLETPVDPEGIPTECAHGRTEDPGEGHPDRLAWILGAHGPEPKQHTADFKTEDARKSIYELERDVADGAKRAEAYKQELEEYVDALRAKTFVTEEPGTKGGTQTEEPLVIMPPPADMDDVVDLTAQAHVARKRRKVESQRILKGPCRTRPGPTNMSDESLVRGWSVPDFLEKYFSDEKAFGQVPIKAIKREEEMALGGPSDENSIAKGFRQIAKLDGVLASREASATAKQKISRLEREVARERFLKEAKEIEKKKDNLVQVLKERGLIQQAKIRPDPVQNQNASQSTPARSSASSIPSKSPSLGQICPVVAVPTSVIAFESNSSVAIWDGWTSTALEDDALSPVENTLVLPAERNGGIEFTSAENLLEQAELETDTCTFVLTSETGGLPLERRNLATTGPRRKVTLETVLEEHSGEGGEGCDYGEAALPSGFDLIYGADASTLDALQRIDEKLRDFVPESEWEEKSMMTLHSLTDCASDADRATSQSSNRGFRSVWSQSKASTDSKQLSLPGDDALREHMEERESRKALASVDDRLQELQSLPPPCGNENVDDATIHSLLLQAKQESVALALSDKVLALTGGELALSGLTGSNHGDTPAVMDVVLPEEAPMRRAQEILNRLAFSQTQEEESFQEAEAVFRNLEAEVEAFDGTRKVATPNEVPGEESPDPIRNMASVAKRLNSIALEVAAIANKPGMDEADIEKLRQYSFMSGVKSEVCAVADADPTDGSTVVVDDDLDFDLDMDIGVSVAESALRKSENDTGQRGFQVHSPNANGRSDSHFVPTLVSAGADDDFSDVSSGMSDVAEARLPEEPNLLRSDKSDYSSAVTPPLAQGARSSGSMKGADSSSTATPSTPLGAPLSETPSSELMKALEIKLPKGDGRWSDQELLNVVRAMDAHFGDQLPSEFS